MCPKCGKPLEPVLMGNQEGGQAKWCPGCSYLETPEQSNPNTGNASGQHVLSIKAFVPDSDENACRRWRKFEALMDAGIQGRMIREAYETAKEEPGRWVATIPIVDPWQCLRLLLGRVWRPYEPRMAVRWDPVAWRVELAFDAGTMMTAAELHPDRRQLLKPSGYMFEWADS